MLFNSLRFLLVFPLIFGVYWAIPARYNTARKVFLIVLSYLLYMNWRPVPALLLLAVTLLTYGGGIWLGKSSRSGGRSARKRCCPCWSSSSTTA